MDWDELAFLSRHQFWTNLCRGVFIIPIICGFWIGSFWGISSAICSMWQSQQQCFLCTWFCFDSECTWTGRALCRWVCSQCASESWEQLYNKTAFYPFQIVKLIYGSQCWYCVVPSQKKKINVWETVQWCCQFYMCHSVVFKLGQQRQGRDCCRCWCWGSITVWDVSFASPYFQSLSGFAHHQDWRFLCLFCHHVDNLCITQGNEWAGKIVKSCIMSYMLHSHNLKVHHSQ